MDTQLLTVIVSTSGSVLVGIFGMFFTSNQLGRRIDDVRADLGKRLDDNNQQMRDLRSEFTAFKDMVNGKPSAIDLGIAKLMDRRNETSYKTVFAAISTTHPH